MSTKPKVNTKECEIETRMVSGRLWKKKKKLRFAKTLRTRKIDLGAHLKQEDK